MKKIIFIAFAILIVWGCGNQKKEVIKIGAVLPLTGDYGAYGTYMKQGMELALNDAVNKGIIKRGEVELVFEDSQADPQKAVNAFKKLISFDKVLACIPATSGVTLAMKPIANQNKVILINATAISNEIEDASDYMYSIIPNAELEGHYLADYAFTKLQKHSAAIIYRNDASGKSFDKSISEKFIELGGHILYRDAHQPKNDNFDVFLNKIQHNKEIDVVFVMSFGPEVANFVKQAKEKNIDRQILTYETFHSPTALEIAKNAANGVIFCSPQFDPNSDSSQITELKKEIFNSYKGQREFNYFIAAHYDAVSLLLKAISAGNRTPHKVKAYFDKMPVFYGITGKIKFLPQGSAIVPLVVYEVKDKKFVIIQK